MEASERDSTQDWLLPEDARPPLLGELEARIEEALVTARASEAAVMSVGAAAIDAAEQARRAAELAERAAATALEAGASGANGDPGAEVGMEIVQGGGEDEILRNFTRRADRVARRLRALV